MVVSKILMSESQFQNFNHLKIHSQYSICECAVKIDDLKDFSKLNKHFFSDCGTVSLTRLNINKECEDRDLQYPIDETDNI